jgi:regulator of replication initiation timing
MQSFDIVKLIEKNSMTRLSKEYEHKLLNKIKDTFTDTQQQLFVSSFYCYLNYRSTDFIVDFDHIWKWIGFTRKDNAKKVLEKNFIIDTDYKVEKSAPQVGGAAFESEYNEKAAPQVGEKGYKKSFCNLGGAGLNKEKITLTVNTFKKFCLKAGTKKADEIHEYYIKLEELLHETMNEESSELREQLEEKTKQNSELEMKNKKLKKHIVRRYETRYKEGNCLYLVTSSEHKDTFKIGITKNINDM